MTRYRDWTGHYPDREFEWAEPEKIDLTTVCGG
jgi:hypothetical protein